MQITGTLLALLLGMFVIFQLLLALGFPYGELAWGGQNGKILPTKLRIASLFSSLFFVFSILCVLSYAEIINLLPPSTTSKFMWFLAVYLFIGIFMNAFSRSKPERIWAPVIGLMFLLTLATLILAQ
jgi:hypothetical protein